MTNFLTSFNNSDFLTHSHYHSAPHIYKVVHRLLLLLLSTSSIAVHETSETISLFFTCSYTVSRLAGESRLTYQCVQDVSAVYVSVLVSSRAYHWPCPIPEYILTCTVTLTPASLSHAQELRNGSSVPTWHSGTASLGQGGQQMEGMIFSMPYNGQS